jgi:hypothetical protein
MYWLWKQDVVNLQSHSLSPTNKKAPEIRGFKDFSGTRDENRTRTAAMATGF